MVELEGRPLVSYQIEAMRACGIQDITIIAGYKAESINLGGVDKLINVDYANTNMVATLMCAKEILDDDLIVSYGDIVYGKEVLEKLLSTDSEVSVVIDKQWRKYWEARMDNPLKDAETLKLDSKGYIKELGQKPKNYGEIEGQYIGLMSFQKEILPYIIELYNEIGSETKNMYMTDFLMSIASSIAPLKAVEIENGWIEVDQPSDLEHINFFKRGLSE
jgi:choline kinase